MQAVIAGLLCSGAILFLPSLQECSGYVLVPRLPLEKLLINRRTLLTYT